MKPRHETASELFASGHNCAQSVLLAFKDLLPMRAEAACNVALGFGGGIARQGEICGAVSGAVMALGLIKGGPVTDLNEKREAAYSATRKLMDAFSLQNGSITCKTLLGGVDLASQAGQLDFQAKGLKQKVCLKCVQDAVKLVDAASQP